MPQQIVFFGSSPFSIPVLEKLSNVKLVITTPDQPVGRHLKLTPNPVKLWAQKHNIPVIEDLKSLLNGAGICEQERRPDAGNDQAARAPAVANTEPQKIGLVAAYGKLIPQNILNTFNGQIYNIHPSLLPKYRGPSPLQQQILDGVTETGVTIIQLDSQMDHGPIVAQEKDTILSTDTPETLGKRLFEKGAELFLNSPLLFPSLKLREGLGVSYPQNDSLATYTKKLTRQAGFIPWGEMSQILSNKQYAISINRKFRAYYPWPGIWSTNPEGLRVKLVSLTPPLVQLEGQPSPTPWPL
jgi:methionyl-tRNA formyltransferase